MTAHDAVSPETDSELVDDVAVTAVNRDWHLASALLIDTAHPDGSAQLGRRRFVVVESGLVGQVEAVRELGAAAARLSTSNKRFVFR